jgi:hypothetical protein
MTDKLHRLIAHLLDLSRRRTADAAQASADGYRIAAAGGRGQASAYENASILLREALDGPDPEPHEWTAEEILAREG